MKCFNEKTEYELLNINQKDTQDGIIIEYQYKEIITREVTKTVFLPRMLDNKFNKPYLKIKNKSFK